MAGTRSLTTPRAALFVPADRADRHERALHSGADAVIFDLEDAVGPGEKAAARAALLATLPGPARPASALLRINSPLTVEGQADLDAVGDLAPDALVVPKADPESVDLAAVSGLPLVALIETAAGILAAAETAAHPAVSVLMLGPVDLGAELGTEESHGGDELLVARGHLVLAAAAAGKPGPLDGPCLSPRDGAALAAEIDRAKRLGFAGKSCIHPAQVEQVTGAFTPSKAEIEWARRAVAAVAGAGGGVATLEGQMVDRPVALRARQILDQVERGSGR